MPDKFISIYEEMQKVENETIREKADIFTFLIGLLPVPIVQQAGQIANKIVSDAKLNKRFEKLSDDIHSTNAHIATIESDIERIGEMAKTVAMVTGLQKQVDELVNMLVDSEFVMDTSNYSSQALINQMIDVDWAEISAVHHSHNILRNTKLRSRKTHLIAHDHSSNVIDGADFAGSGDTIYMDRVVQKGINEVADGQLGFGEGGEIGFGINGMIGWGPPETVSATCPRCGNGITAYRRDIVGKAFFQCPHCYTLLPSKFNG